jgi:c-di-GMP-binding flagellar brake protein YcgR
MADRRERVRFDLTGQLWASLDFKAPTIVRDLAIGGALVETTLPPEWSPLRIAQVSLCDDGPTVTVVVRHITRSPGEARHRIGLEFMNKSPSAQAHIARIVVAAETGA